MLGTFQSFVEYRSLPLNITHLKNESHRHILLFSQDP